MTFLFLFILFGTEMSALLIMSVMLTYEKYFKDEEVHVPGERVKDKF
jgi:hypothetical protein